MVNTLHTKVTNNVHSFGSAIINFFKKFAHWISTPYRKHPKISLIVTAILVIALAGLLIWAITHPKKTVTSNNPIIASYQQQLPQLADTAKNNPKDAKSLNNYAVALYATGDYQKAKEQYEAEAKINKSDATLQNNLGNTYRDLGEYDKAIAAYQESIKLNPKLINSYVNLANVYTYTLNKKDLGITTYQNALKNLPNNQEIQVLLATAYEQSGDKASARSTFQQVLSEDSNNVAAQAGLKRLE